MSALIPLTEHEGEPCVDARELHGFLDIGRDFSSWIKGRIADYGFAEKQDFDLVPRLGEQVSGTKHRKDYLISLPMAKELSMVERNAKGKEARRYFIECERKVIEGAQFKLPTTFPEALRLLADSSEKNETLELKVTEDAPKVEFYDRVTESNTVCQMAVAAQVAKLDFGRNDLMRKLREMGVLMSGGQRHNHPKQSYVNQGLFTLEESKYTNEKTGQTHINFTTYVTQKGIDWIIKKFRKGDAA